MMEWLTPLLSAVLPSLVCGVLMALFNRRQNRKDKEAAERDEAQKKEVNARAEARKKESFLALEMNMANAKLSYAVAMAIKRGKPNGEVEDGIEAYEAAKKKYIEFLNQQALERLVN